jgi:hypothetical protein
VLNVNTDRAGNISIRTIGDSHDLWCSNDGDKIVCEYNPAWQPVGLSAKKFNRMIGEIMRSGQFVGVSTPWLKVPLQTKEDIWNSLMVHINWKLLICHSMCTSLIIICLIHL